MSDERMGDVRMPFVLQTVKFAIPNAIDALGTI